MSSKIDISNIVQVVYYIEDGEQCWSLDMDDVTRCEQRGYPYQIVEYEKVAVY